MTLHRRLHDLYTQHRDRLYAYALSLTGDREAAEDAVHTAIVRILGNGAEPVELAPYLFRSVRNAAVDEHRRVRRFVGGSDEEAQAAVAPGVVLDPDLDRALAVLPPDQRESIVLKIFVGLSFREIAAIREVPLSTAASWYRRGIARLREMMEGEP